MTPSVAWTKERVKHGHLAETLRRPLFFDYLLVGVIGGPTRHKMLLTLQFA